MHFRPDDPVLADPDRLPVPKPLPVHVSQIYDFLENTFLLRPEADEQIPPAENVNTLGEVPDSSWFTNRVGRSPLSVRDLLVGPNQGDGPHLGRPWLITGVKSQGVTPGFTIRDARGDTYFIKFDPPGHPQLSTSSEVIATKFFHAFGYNVPENYLTHIAREQLTTSRVEGSCGSNCILEGHRHARAIFVDEEGKKRPLLDSDVDRILRRASRLPDGRIPVVASKQLPGEPIGHFKYFGTRTDDANDIFPHENRRELRGLKVFASWLNHDDSRSINSLDTYLGEPGEGYVQHHLIDFGSCFGSGSIKVQTRRAGNEYILEWKPAIRSALTLGIWDRPWRHVKFPDYPAIGRFESDFFDPGQWKPEYPNAAFDRMLPEDAFWAAKIIAHFDDEKIRAIVSTGQIFDPEAEEYLVRTLIRRRDKILRFYFSRLNPLASFRVDAEEDSLSAVHFGVQAGLATACSYRFRWFRHDNVSGRRFALSEAGTTDRSEFRIPEACSTTDRFLVLQVAGVHPKFPEWARNVDVYVRCDGAPTVVGVEREAARPGQLKPFSR